MCGIVAGCGNMNVGPLMPYILHRGIGHGRVIGPVGHVRLPIVGLPTVVKDDYAQPVNAGRFIVAFVGEVLDFRDTDGGLACDLPLVVEAAIRRVKHPIGNEWKLSTHDGFWAVVVYDKEEDHLHIICDYLAQKPMYYRTDAPLTASELEPLVHGPFPVAADELYFADVAKWGYCPDTQRTPYEQIKRVLPGEHVVLRPGAQPFSFGCIDPLTPALSNDVPVLVGQLYDEMDAAVRRRVIASDVPVACLLSGGLDSAITYTLACRYGPVQPYYVTDVVQDDLFGTEERSAVLACLLHARQHKPDSPSVHVLRHGGPYSAEALLDVMQEPIDLGSLGPQYALSRAVTEKVCLTGDGADELFGGYSRAGRYDSQASDVWRELVNWHLPRLDRVMMRNCIEVRSPFLARNVAAIALALPWELRKDKKVLRDLFKNDLPAGISDRPKAALRTSAIAQDREANTLALISAFRREKNI